MPTLKRWSFLSILTLVLCIICSGIYGSRLLVMGGISVHRVRPSSFLCVEIKDLEYIARKKPKNIGWLERGVLG
jgi:hypothetical protein